MNHQDASATVLPNRLSRERTYYQNVHSLLLQLGGLHFVICTGFAVFTDTWLLVLLIAAPAWLIAWWVCRQYPLALVARLTMAVVFMVFTGVIIQQSGGDLEGHFSYFVMLAALVVYCDWRPLVMATVMILIHHFTFVMLQPLNLGFMVFNDNRPLWEHFFVHVAVGAVQTVVLIYAAHILHKLIIASFIVSDAALLIAAGNLDIKLDPAAVQNSEMLAAVQTMQAQLIVHRDHLNGLVEDRTQELEKAKQAAEAATRAKSLFLANMSHEIRTPMNAVIGLTYLVLKTELNAKQKDYLQKIKASAGSLLHIINDILDFSKIEAGMLNIEQLDFNLNAVLEQVASLSNVRAVEKGITLQIALNPNVPVLLIGDALRLGQILLNLVSNALKFTESGEVILSVNLGKQDEKNSELIFAVRDSGIGMTEQQQAHLFQFFSQADASTTRRFGGTGLGLAISKQLVEAMGGSIFVKSTPNVGSTFTFKIPLGLQMMQTTTNPPEPQNSPARDCLQGIRILLAEDNEINQMIAEELLNDVGIIVDIADNGSIACDKALSQTAHYDMILMDVQMPVMDGLEATQKIREAGVGLPIIAMTAHAMDEEKQRCLRVGMDDHVSKPIDPDAFYETLAKWVKSAAVSMAE